ncbi:hypothetical protein CU044_3744 [Streptomyces sp. L-9-10]|uniref:hypothetical protein n=1 Tax=Streptomyces sp. L-9-10 TaxID=1478131 RepID=UPI00101DC019|nr:hypothetical protein [Streptomyces sp. L-9-10]RYJ26451.1 hypothetical protein CU044_3744 [Streptomyces sp. L-9-10]
MREITRAAATLAAHTAGTIHERCENCRQPTCRCEPNTSLTALAAAVGVLRPSSLTPLLRRVAGVNR